MPSLPLRVFALFLLFASPVWAGFREEFEAAKAKKPSDVEALQKASAQAEENNPEYYLLLADYWFMLSQKPWVRTNPSGTNGPDSAAPGKMARLGVNDPSLANRAPQLLTDALRHFPGRIDISLGLAHCLLKEDRPDASVDVIVALLAAYQRAPSSFLDREGAPLDATLAGKHISESAYGYCLGFYAAKNDASLARSRRIALAMHMAFPENTAVLNILSAFALRSAQYGDAITYLERAHDLDPADGVVALNLADAYLNDGRRAKARAVVQDILKSKAMEPSHGEAQKMLEKLQ